MKEKLTIEKLITLAEEFCKKESSHPNKDLFGVTDGKAVGTYIEHKFQNYIDESESYNYEKGSSAKGIDLPGETIQTDIKVTSVKQPQSSCPFKDAKQKIFGLGYNILIFVYDKSDDSETSTTKLDFVSCNFLDKSRTADYTTTYRLREMLKDGANQEDIVAYLNDRNIPADEITKNTIAKHILENTPNQGYLTISNALQWRLQYGRIVKMNEEVDGITKIVDNVSK